MSNLLKGFFVEIDDENARVLDSNDLIEQRLREEEERRARQQELSAQELEDDGPAEFTEGLPVESLDALTADDADSTVIKNAPPSPPDESESINEELEAARAELESLRTEADGILESARQEAEAIKESAYAEAKEEGYQAGVQEGMASVEVLKKETEEKALALEAEYQQKLDELEPQFIDALTDIYEHIFKIDLDNYRGIVEHLLTDAINSSEGARNIIVHISKDDYAAIAEQKEALLTETGMTEDNVEFVQDATLGPASCMIETENGIYDCSLETELKELKRKLMLLAYHRE